MNDDLFEILDLTCNYQRNPLGIDETPVFSWKVRSGKNGDKQTAYHLRVISEKGVVWDTGVVPSSNHCAISYKGQPLLSKTPYKWNIEIKNQDGIWHKSTFASFETGKYGQPWKGHWISAPWCKLDQDDQSAIYLRKLITITKPVRRARLYICGLGLYEAWINGNKVSDYELEPTYTKYDVESLYRVYDVTHFLQTQGNIALGIILGNGWYNCFTKDAWNGPQATWRGIPRLMCELTISYEDNTFEQICSDTSWKVNKGPIVFNSIRSGEHYDARMEEPLWCDATMDDHNWQNAIQVRSPGGIVKAARGDPIRVIEERAAKQVWITRDGHRIFDFGQNFAGKAKLVSWGPAGSEYILRYAEELTPDRQHVDQSHLRCFIHEGEFQTDRYISNGYAGKQWSSKFVYHGFRYVELETIGVSPTTAELSALIMHTDFQQHGYFNCSDEDLNVIQRMANWSTVSNSMGLPTSDPHREKNAWTGDNGFASEQMLINYDSLLMQAQWLDSVCDCQRVDGAIPCVCPSTGWGFNWGNGPDWSLVLTQMPWRLYCHTGDKGFLIHAFPYLEKHFHFMSSMANDDILNYGIGDWCAPFNGPAVSKNMESFKAPRALTDTLCYYEAACILEKICLVLGRHNSYTKKKKAIQQAIIRHFIQSDLSVSGNCQTSDAGIIWNHILTPEQEKKLLERFLERIAASNNCLDFGVLGQRYVMETLGESGNVEQLFLMLKTKAYPSYLYLSDNGCTTLTECWNLGGSHNHIMFSHVSAALYKYIAGLSEEDAPSEEGHFMIRPSLLTNQLTCWEKTRHGTLSIQWKKEKNYVELHIQVPFGCTARLIPPLSVSAEQEQIVSGSHCRKWSFKACS